MAGDTNRSAHVAPDRNGRATGRDEPAFAPAASTRSTPQVPRILGIPKDGVITLREHPGKHTEKGHGDEGKGK